VSVIQGESALAAVHAQPARTPTVIVTLPPAVGIDCVIGATVNVHGAAFCATVTVVPATVSDALRESPSLAEASKVTLPLPLPELIDPMTSHAAEDCALHVQPLWVSTRTVTFPPPVAIVVFAAETVKRQAGF
jgi:hypothetical protein